MISVYLILNFFLIVNAQLYPVFQTALVRARDACEFNQLTRGECKRLRNCPFVYREFLKGIYPENICEYNGYEPVVCCPRGKPQYQPQATQVAEASETVRVSQRGSLAKKKCDEFGALVCSFNSGDEGQKAQREEFAHMVAIGYESIPRGKILWLCGGSIVSPNYIITAASCAYSLNYGNAKYIRAGDVDLTNDNDDSEPQDRRIISRIIYPDYQRSTQFHDIALLKVENPINFQATVRPICLALKPTTNHYVSEDNEAIAMGWGLQSDEIASSHLMKMNLKLMDHRSCDALYTTSTSKGVVDIWQLCAGAENKDTCQDGNGGSLVTVNPDYKCMFDMIGVTSFGRLCGRGTPGIYTRIYNYIPWLENVIWGNETDYYKSLTELL